MNTFKTNCRTSRSGEGGLAILIIVVLLIGAGFWWLFSTKATAERESRKFVNEAVQRITVQHDLDFLTSRMGPAAKVEFPPSHQRNLIETLTQLGVPAQPIQIEGKLLFDSHFFRPHGLFTARLNYPGRPGTLEMEISHPVGRWQFDAVRLGLEQAR